METSALNRAVKRNPARFPADFVFQLTADEEAILRSQSVTSNSRGGRRYPPYAFTEQGVAMLSSVLNSDRAVLAGQDELARRLDDLEATVGDHGEQLSVVVEAIRAIIAAPPSPGRRIGFRDE